MRACTYLAVLLLSTQSSRAFSPPHGTLSARRGRALAGAHGPASRLRMFDAWAAYNAALVSEPLLTKSITAGLIIGAGDAAAQQIERSRTGEKFDVVRYLRWAVFGLVLQGPWNHAFYSLLDSALPPTADPFTLVTLEKVGIDQFVQAPIFTVIILCFFAVVEGKGLRFAYEQVRTELGGILIKNWSVFLPATVINLAFCPPEFRVLFLNCVFFGWVVYLSSFLNEAPSKDVQ